MLYRELRDGNRFNFKIFLGIIQRKILQPESVLNKLRYIKETTLLFDIGRKYFRKSQTDRLSRDMKLYTI